VTHKLSATTSSDFKALIEYTVLLASGVGNHAETMLGLDYGRATEEVEAEVEG